MAIKKHYSFKNAMITLNKTTRNIKRINKPKIIFVMNLYFFTIPLETKKQIVKIHEIGYIITISLIDLTGLTVRTDL